MYSLKGAGYDLLMNPDNFYETLGMQNPTKSSKQSSGLAPTKENLAKRAAQTQSKPTTEPKKKKPGLKNVFETYESPYAESPMFTPRYDWQKDQQERMRRFGITPTTQTTPISATAPTQPKKSSGATVGNAYTSQQTQQNDSGIMILPNGEEV